MYIGQAPGLGQRSVFRFVSTADQTTFSGRDGDGLILTYTPGRGNTQVFVDGARIAEADYVANNGSQIVFNKSLPAGLEVIVVADSPFSPVDTYKKAEAYGFANGAASLRNKIINGNFAIAQRGLGPTNVPSGGGYVTADRWYFRSQGISGGTISVRSYKNVVREVWPSGSYLHMSRTGLTAYTYVGQKIEGGDTLSGQKATLSFHVHSDVSETITVDVVQNFGTGGSPSTSVTLPQQQASVVAGEHKVLSFTFDLPSVADKTFGTNGDDHLVIQINPQALNGVIRISEVQLESGSVATPYEQRPFGLELSLCQRYYEKSYDHDTALGTATTTGAWYFRTDGTLAAQYPLTPFMVVKRVDPTVALYSTVAPTTAGNVRNASTGSNVTGSITATRRGLTQLSLGTAPADANVIQFHWTADAEL